MLQCLRYRIATADLTPFPPNVTIVFNFVQKTHDLP